MSSQKILFVGDSLIEFNDWQTRFPSYQVINLGVAGETVEELLSRTERIIKHETAPDMILIMIGTNNMVMENFAFLPSYERIIEEFASAYPKALIVINSLLPMQVPWLADTAITRINARLSELTEQKNILYLDVYQQFVGQQGNVRRDYFLEDGVHLSDAGYRAWSESIENFLKALEW